MWITTRYGRVRFVNYLGKRWVVIENRWPVTHDEPCREVAVYHGILSRPCGITVSWSHGCV